MTNMDHWQGSVGRSCGQYYGGGAGGVPGRDRRETHSYSSHRSEYSTRRRDVGSFSRRHRQNRYFD